MCNFVIYAILSYYTNILDITMTVGIFEFHINVMKYKYSI